MKEISLRCVLQTFPTLYKGYHTTCGKRSADFDPRILDIYRYDT